MQIKLANPRGFCAGVDRAIEIVNRAKDGREYWLDIEIQPLRDADGAVTGFMAIEADITAALAG